jgi:hypothetical protein
MDIKKFKSILQDALEDELPASQIDLLPAVQARLVVRNTARQGESMNRARNRKLALSTLIVVAALTIATLTTPQGRAFAQNLLQFFTRAESDTLPLQPWQIAPPEHAQAESTAMPLMPLITIISEAERLAGFDAAEIPSTPRGFTFLGARLYGKAISIEYEAKAGGGSLIIVQSRAGYVLSDWDAVPADEIVPVKIGELDGEFVKGTFVLYPGDNSATWNPEAPVLRLRWVKDGIWFEMTKFGDVESIKYLDRSGLIELAKSLVYEPTEANSDPFPLTIAEAKDLAGFELLLPGTEATKGHQFNGAMYDPKSHMVSLSYTINGADGFVIEGYLINEQPLGEAQDVFPLQGVVGASAPIDEVKVGEFQGAYVEGVWELTARGPVWRSEPFLKTLRWKTDRLLIEIVYGDGDGSGMTKEDLMAFAESME